MWIEKYLILDPLTNLQTLTDAGVYPNLQQPTNLSENTYISASNKSVFLLFVEPNFCLDNFSGSFNWVEQIRVQFLDHFVLNVC